MTGTLLFKYLPVFVVLLLDISSANEAVKMAEGIQKTMEKPWNIYGKSLQVTTSMGIAMAPSEGASTFSMLKNADIALYEAKEDGRNSIKLRG
ncbi:GGDEF domain-containing protein [Lentibacillus lipolyticus]|nr:GGDEF domain-containing protein [Lentibacillus lipolyticus]